MQYVTYLQLIAAFYLLYRMAQLHNSSIAGGSCIVSVAGIVQPLSPRDPGQIVRSDLSRTMREETVSI